MRKTILLLSCALVSIGYCGSPLTYRLYFVEGGQMLWLATALQTCGWPIFLIPLMISYFYRRQIEGPNTKLILMNMPTLIATATIGVLLALVDYLYAFGIEHLPVSTAFLITSSQLVFTAVFAFFLLKQKFTVYSIIAIVLLTAGAACLALDKSSDTTEGETDKLFFLAFLMTCAVAILSGLIMPSVQLVYVKLANEEISYSLITETQIVIAFFATAVAIVGMLINSDFKGMPREAREFQLGEAKYYVVLVSSAILSQFFLLGSIGVVFCASALLEGIIVAVLLPVSEVLAVICFHEKFQLGKGLALGLCLLGFASHFYGEIRNSKKSNFPAAEESQMLLDNDVHIP